MATAVNFDLRHGSRLRKFVSRHGVWFLGLLFAGLMAVQALGFLVLGTGRAGRGLAESILGLVSLLSIAGAWIAFRRAQGITALFWFLFAVVLVVLLVPTALQTYDTLFDQSTLVRFHLASALLPLWRPDPDDALSSGFVSARTGEVRNLSRSVSGGNRRWAHLLDVLLSSGAADVARRCAPAQPQHQRRAKLAAPGRSLCAPAIRPRPERSQTVAPIGALPAGLRGRNLHR